MAAKPRGEALRAPRSANERLFLVLRHKLPVAGAGPNHSQVGFTIRHVVSRVAGNRVTLGIEAPSDVRIVRGELRVDTDEKSPSARVAGGFHHATDTATASVPHLAK